MAVLDKYIVPRKNRNFESKSFYSKDGDFITLHFEDVDYFAERVDEYLTVYKPLDGQDRCVGFKLKGVAHLARTVGDFKLCHETNDWALNILLLAGKASSTSGRSADTSYKRVADKAQGVRVNPRELAPA